MPPDPMDYGDVTDVTGNWESATTGGKVNAIPTEQQLSDLGASLLRDALGEADLEPLPWPDDTGFFWTKSPCGFVTLCRADRAPNGPLGIVMIGSMLWRLASDPALRGWRFWRLPIPEYVR
jgi:hypothetical protein